MEGILREIGARVKIEEVNRIGKGMWLVKLENLDQKKEVMMKKRMLKERREKIMDDLMEREEDEVEVGRDSEGGKDRRGKYGWDMEK